MLQTTVVTLSEIFITTRGPLVVRGLVVVHDGFDVGAGPPLTVVSRISGRSIEIVVHASVVTNLVSHNLKITITIK